MDTYFRLLRYVKPYLPLFLVSIVLTFFYSLLSVIPIFLVKNILDDVFIQKKQEMLVLISYGLVFSYLLMGITHFFSSYILRYVGQRVILDVRNQLYRHLQFLSLRFFQQNPTGTLMSRITNDTLMLEDAIARKIGDILKDFFSLIALSGYLFFLSYYYALLSLVVLPLALAPIVKFAQKLRKISIRTQEYMADLNSVLLETFTGINIVKAFCMEDFEYNKFQHENRGVFKYNIRAARLDVITPPLLEFIGAVGGAIIISYGGFHVIRGTISAGTFMTFIIALFSMHLPIRKLNASNFSIQRALASAIRIFAFLDIPADIKDSPGAVELPAFRDKVVFDDVSFKYDEEPVLRSINLTVHYGQTIALVGESGAGKSTLVNMIPRFFDPSAGQITIDGHDLRQVTIKSLRSQLGIVTQDTILFNDTVRNNIAYGQHEASLNRIQQVARMAYAHEFIEKMPEGYETIIGERGTKLSGGQKQRIAIARALFKNPPILILDEATSALDTESEKMVQMALSNLMRDRTTFVIAHRLSTIRNADLIVVLEQGRIVEMGSHDELISAQGIYHRLHGLQFETVLKNS
ncbi:ABC transporter ATP-binding protein [bacterium]|nr:ABC transporter ATP-binding protein [bacterium]